MISPPPPAPQAASFSLGGNSLFFKELNFSEHLTSFHVATFIQIRNSGSICAISSTWRLVPLKCYMTTVKRDKKTNVLCFGFLSHCHNVKLNQWTYHSLFFVMNLWWEDSVIFIGLFVRLTCGLWWSKCMRLFMILNWWPIMHFLQFNHSAIQQLMLSVDQINVISLHVRTSHPSTSF